MGNGWLIADLIGVAVFAASGASAGVAKRFDIFGVIFVGTVAALGGGIVRDLLIGAVPPYAFLHWPYMAVAVVASAIAREPRAWPAALAAASDPDAGTDIPAARIPAPRLPAPRLPASRLPASRLPDGNGFSAQPLPAGAPDDREELRQ